MALTGEELSKRQTQKKVQQREARLQIVSELWLKGWSCRQIAQEVTRRLQLATPCNQSTIKRDKDLLLKQWHEDNMGNVEDWVQLELARIDNCVYELWQAWEKSKKDYTRYKAEREEVELEFEEEDKATGKKTKSKRKMPATKLKQKQEQMLMEGNVAYIAEIRQQLVERRKLLGLYKPEKQEITGKDGQPLNPKPATASIINPAELTDEELAVLYGIAKKRDSRELE